MVNSQVEAVNKIAEIVTDKKMHTFEEQIGGQLRAGFMLTDVYEDTDGFGILHEYNIPTFWATRAVKR